MFISFSPYLGRYAKSEGAGNGLCYEGDRHLLLFGPTGSGKGVGILVPNLLMLGKHSIIVTDPKGELAAVTANRRRQISDDVVILNPFGVLGLPNAGFNPLASLDPDSPTFFDDAAGLGEAMIKVEGRDPHWDESARVFVTALIMWEVKLAKAENRTPSLEHVRYLLTEADEVEGGKQVAGLAVTAQKMMAMGGFQIQSLISRFVGSRDEIASIRSTADRQTSWLLSSPMRESLARNDIDFADLKKRRITVYVILPAERMRTYNVWLRLVVVSALRALSKPGGIRTLFMLDEFFQLGRLAPIEDAFAIARGFNIQLWPVLQDINQLKSLYKENWQTFVANAGVVQAFAPNDLETADWLSRRAGDTTAIAASYNSGDSQNARGQNASQGMGYTQQKRAMFLPQELMGMSKKHGLIFVESNPKSIPFYAEPYFDDVNIGREASPNPFYAG